jgi:hypothetical protein
MLVRGFALLWSRLAALCSIASSCRASARLWAFAGIFIWPGPQKAHRRVIVDEAALDERAKAYIEFLREEFPPDPVSAIRHEIVASH